MFKYTTYLCPLFVFNKNSVRCSDLEIVGVDVSVC